MVDRNIVNKLGLSQDELEKQVSEMFTDEDSEFLEEVLRAKVDSSLPGAILKGTIVSQIGNDVIVEVGLKSEGVVDASEFESPEEIEPGKPASTARSRPPISIPNSRAVVETTPWISPERRPFSIARLSPGR